MKAMETEEVAAHELIRMAPAISLALRILTERFLTVLGIIANSAMFGYVLWQPSWDRVAAATLFALAVYFLVHHGEPRRGVKQ